MKLPIIDTRNTVEKQIKKVKSELKEIDIAYRIHAFQMVFKENKYYEETLKELQLEALDGLTAQLNLVHMLNIPAEVQEEHRQKMLTYEHDVSRMYKIIKWIDINLEEGTE